MSDVEKGCAKCPKAETCRGEECYRQKISESLVLHFSRKPLRRQDAR